MPAARVLSPPRLGRKSPLLRRASVFDYTSDSAAPQGAAPTNGQLVPAPPSPPAAPQDLFSLAGSGGAAGVDPWDDVPDPTPSSPAGSAPAYLDHQEQHAAEQVLALIVMLARLPALAQEATGLLRADHLQQPSQAG